MLDPLRSITGNPLFYVFDCNKENSKNKARQKIPEGYQRIIDIIKECGVSDNAIRWHAKKRGIVINNGLLLNADADAIIDYYAGNKRADS